MIAKRLAIVEAVLLFGLGSVFLIPKKIEILPAGISHSLPTFVGEWYGADQPILEGEKEILGPDTQFARKLYTNGRGDQIFVSLVFSGPDMSTSIHRPERCLPAQGWTVVDTKATQVPIGNVNLSATRLCNLRNLPGENTKQNIYSLDYYWFVGHESQTASHLQRTWIDISDRVLKGENQQWAFVTIASTITKGLQPFGRSEEETDQLIKNFIRELIPQLQKQSLAGAR